MRPWKKRGIFGGTDSMKSKRFSQNGPGDLFPSQRRGGKGKKKCGLLPFLHFLRGRDASFDRGEGKGDLGAREGKEEGAESTNKMNAD